MANNECFLTENRIGPNGANRIFESLKDNTTLTELNLCCYQGMGEREKKMKQKKTALLIFGEMNI